MPNRPGDDAALIRHLQGALQDGGDGINWGAGPRQAQDRELARARAITDGQPRKLDQAFPLAALWLSEATTISELTVHPAGDDPRPQWVEATLPVWQELAEPVATSIADALTDGSRSRRPKRCRAALRRGPPHAHRRRIAVRLAARPGRRSARDRGRERR